MSTGKRTHNLGPNPWGNVLFLVEEEGRFTLCLPGQPLTTLSAEQIRLIADLAGVSQGLRR